MCHCIKKTPWIWIVVMVCWHIVGLVKYSTYGTVSEKELRTERFCEFSPKQVYLWGSILEKKRLDTLVGALCCVGRGFGCAGRADDVFVFIFMRISDVYHGAWAKQSLALVNATWFWAIPCSKGVMWSERNGSKRRETAVAATNAA